MSDFEEESDDLNQTSEEEVSIEDSDTEEDLSDDEDLPSSSDDDDEAGPSTGLWTQIIGQDELPATVDFTANPGPRVHLPTTAMPVDYCKLMITGEFIDLLVMETNLYADQWIENHQQYLRERPRSRVHIWIAGGHTTREEITAFLAVIFNMGLIKKATIFSYWDVTNESQSTPWFVKHFNRDRFMLLKKFLHFSNNLDMPAVDHPDYKLFKVKHVIDIFSRNFKKLYVPHQDVSVDESMVGFRGKTPHLRQYLPNKHHARFGIKLWCLCDATSHYTCHFEVYKGAHNAQDKQSEEGTTYALVMRLLTEGNVLHQGYHVGLDNYFSSPKLFFDLFKMKTLATGTVRSNRKGLPKQILKAKLKNQEVAERRKGPLLCVAYKDHNKRPIILSTATTGGMATTNNARGKPTRRPKCVLKYNSAMGGVDQSDAQLYAYLSERRTIKWTQKLVFAILGRSLLNAFILYKEHTSLTPKLSRYSFTIQVIESLMGSYEPSKVVRKRRSKTNLQDAHTEAATDPAVPHEHEYAAAPPMCKLVKIGKTVRRQCVYKHSSRKRSVWECSHCKVTLCPDCFMPYHKDKNLI